MGQGELQLDAVKLTVKRTNVDANDVIVKINNFILNFRQNNSLTIDADAGAHYDVFLVVRGARGKSGKLDIQRDNKSLRGFPIECTIDNDYGVDHEPAAFDL
jgi:hypothetical protein